MAQPGGDRPPPEEAPPPHLVEYVPLPRATDVDPANSKTSLNVDGLVRRKNTSFKITNILPSRPPSNDPDESGEDDPDDSRTEDISDNIDEIGFISMRRPSAGILRRGSIPGDLVAGTMFPIAEFGFVGGSSGASTPGQGPVHGPRDRFKVVKIETSAPQKRGRWTCIEYADKNLSALSNTQSSATTNTTTTTTSEPIITSAATATVNTLPSVEPVITTMDSDPTPQLMSPTGPTKGLQHSSEEPEGSSQPMSYAHPDLIVMPTSTVPSLPPGASYSTSPVPYSSHPGSVATSLPSVSQHQQSIPPTAVSSQMPIYTPVSLPVASIVSMSQPMPTYSQSMGMSHTGTMSQHSVVMSQAGATSHTGAISHAGVGSQPVSMSQPVVMSQMIAQQSTSSPVVSIAASSDLVVSTSSQYPIPSQSSIPTSLQGFDALGTSAVQAGSGLQSPSSSQVPTNSSQTFSGPPSSIHQTVSQQSYSTQQQSPMQQQQQQPAQFQTMSQPQFQPIQQSTFHSSQQAMQQQQQQQPIQLPQQPQQTAMPPIMAPSQQQQTTATSQQPMVQQQATVASQQPMVQQQTTSIGQQPMVQQQGTPVGQQPMVQQQATPVGQQTMVQQQGPSVSQQPMVQQQGPSVGQQQMVQQQSTPVGQQSIVQQQSTPVGQQPMVQQQGTPMGQQSMVQQQAAPSSQQPMVQQATSSMSQQPMVQQQASGVSQQQLVQQQTTSVGQQPMVQQQATVPNQQSLVQPATVVQPTPVIQPVVQQTPVIMTSQAPLSVSIGMPMSSADTIYMGSSSGITSTTMTRHVTVGPIPAQSYLAVSSPLVLPTNTASTVSSIPGSRDPVQGGATLTPIVNPAARDPSYNVPPGPFPDSQPVASDLLVERLEEISTQQEMVEDPESYEIRMLTSKCTVCGLPDRPAHAHGQFPCGHPANQQRRLSTAFTPGVYSSMACSPAPSPPALSAAPAQGFLLSPSTTGGVGHVSALSPVKESPKSLLASICSASGSNQGAIDNRIEQAMDLVKSHLMNAVRSEVEELKEKIIKLEEIISQLQSENEFLRANVHRDVLLQLQQQQQLQIQQQQSLGSPPTQPALPQTPQLN